MVCLAAAEAAAQEAHLELRFAGPRQSRTVLEGILAVPAKLLTLNAHGFFNLRLSGEVRSAGHAYDTFSYRYDVAGGEVDKPLAMSFERTLRPGDFQLVLAVVDLQSGWRYDVQRPLHVPRLASPAAADAAVAAPAPPAPSSAATPPAPRLELLAPRAPILTGKQRFDAVAEGVELAKVRFLLDGRPVFGKRTPPYSVELDLGDEPRVVRLAVEGYDEAGELVAADELLLNATGSGFAVRLVEPLAGRVYRGPTTARARVEVPPGLTLEGVEFWSGDARVALDSEPPFQARLHLDGEQQVIRAVARLADGTTAEDVRLVNGRGHLQELEVDWVELYTAALDRRERPVHDLAAADFAVSENGVAQKVARVERVENLPARLALVLDVSDSMRDRLAATTRAAAGFLEQVLEPGDEAAIVTFNRQPRLVVDFTGDQARLANGLVGLSTSGGTRLLDSLAFTLEQLPAGGRAQRAVLLLSDGQDVESRLGSAEVVELARRLGVTVYVVALGVASDDLASRDLLRSLAEETGGRSYFLGGTDRLAEAYAAIARDLRARYVLAYQSSSAGGGFRLVAVDVERPGVTARTIRGYYP